MSTKIEWTDETWNPTVGCSKVSPGCDNCYAIRVAARGMSPEHHGLTERRMTEDGDLLPPDWTGEVRCLPERLGIPLRWRKPRRVFVDSMSDLFHPQVPDEFIADVFAVMGLAREHTFQVLTKRPRRMAEWIAGARDDVLIAGDAIAQDESTGLSNSDRASWRSSTGAWQPWCSWPLPNVWLGTSVEDQHQADRRIPHLLATPAAVRFLSCEPLLGPIEMGMVPGLQDERGIDWVIVGGESGPGARPMHPEWARGLRDQCVAAGVPFHFKQAGEWTDDSALKEKPDCVLLGDGRMVRPDEWALHVGDPTAVYLARVGKKAAGRELDGRTWDQYPETV